MDDDVKEIEKTKYKTLTLDVDYYQSFLDDADIPEDRKQEFIETIWNIVVQFIDLGFGIHPLQQVRTSNSDWEDKLTLLMKDSISNDADTKHGKILEKEEL